MSVPVRHGCRPLSGTPYSCLFIIPERKNLFLRFNLYVSRFFYLFLYVRFYINFLSYVPISFINGSNYNYGWILIDSKNNEDDDDNDPMVKTPG